MEIATIAPFVMMASGVASAGMGVVQGIQSSKAAALEKAQYEEEAATLRVAADQEEVARRRQLESILATNETLRGARGLSFSSGSADALRAENMRLAETDIATARLNKSAAISRVSYGALGAGMREKAGLFSGAGAVVSGLGTAAQGALKYAGKA